MEFLLKATRESHGKKKLKQIIILTSRALAIVALIMAVARPLSSQGFLNWGGGKLDTVILILDRSASMELSSTDSLTTKRETALQLARNSFQELGDTRFILLDSASGIPISVTSLNTLDTIAQTKATDTTANIPALLNSAIQYVLQNDTGRTEIWLASDLQENDWLTSSGKWNNIRTGIENLSDQARLKILSLKSAPNQNISIQLERVQRENDSLQIDLEIRQSGRAEQQKIPLTFSLNEAQVTETVDIRGNITRLTKSIPLTGKSGFGYLQLPADSNLRDNTAYFSYGEEQPIYSAVVATLPEARTYLQLAAAPPGFQNQQVQSYLPHQPISWDSLSLVLWQAPLPQSDQQQPLLDFMNKGGVIAFFPPVNTDSTEFLDTQWGVLSKSAKGKFFIVPKWNRKDGPLRNGEDGTPIAVEKLKAIKRRGIVTQGSSLAQWQNNDTFLTRELHGKGAAYFVSTMPDYTWSNLGDADVILPLIQRLVQKGNSRFGSSFATTIGALPADVSIDKASRKRLDEATSSSPLNAEYETGVYKFGERTLAVNIAPEETQADALSNEAIDKLFAGVPYTLFEKESKADSAFSQQLWQAFLVAMLIFMITEAILCLAQKRKNLAPKS